MRCCDTLRCAPTPTPESAMTARKRDAARRPAEPRVTEARADVMSPPLAGQSPRGSSARSRSLHAPAERVAAPHLPRVCHPALGTESATPAEPGNDTLPSEREG